ncbi:hypothetical protein QN277_003958 [Acacia crassicarpa]|uniref:Protein decapping 5 n=1 Tax=Acacia crassicarpa TaxID=499986 RepID=A0AAE1J1Y8_9FABA|nr:hypothetical protein QN277_003958 [Acacia crassicarpa]
MASESASRSSSAADSYVGSLISLTSKSEIRYEGILYNIDTEASSIGLRNVRSFGTEGRKKDGPQIPPGDKVYEFILFRGSDIKDLQVKSSPPVQPTPPINNDPAIIQSHYPRPVTTSTSLPSSGTGPLNDLNSHTTQLGMPGLNFQGPLPLYQPGGNPGSWGASPAAPNANGGGLAMPLYWPGYYGAPNGLPHITQQSLLRPPPGLSMPSSMQQPIQYPNFNPALPTGSSTLPELPPPSVSANSSSPIVTSASLIPPNLASSLPPVPSATLASETLPGSVPNKAPAISLAAATLTANLPSLTPLVAPSPDGNAIVPPISSKPNAVSSSSLPYQNVPQLTPANVGTTSSVPTETTTPPLVTPGQLLQPGPTITSSSSNSGQTSHKDVEVVKASSTSSPDLTVTVSAESQPPILPLPVNSRPTHRPSEVAQNYQPQHQHQHHSYGYRGRGRGRGVGGPRPVTKFSEDFDFMAMNEKFNKDEVWGHLGKNKSHSKEKDGEDVSDEDDGQDGYNGEESKNEVKTVYNKDDFFDSLSCNSLDHYPQNGRTRYSEQVKIDTETFGDFVRPRGGRGGRGLLRGGGGRSRGGYYGRGYGYTPRGRGRGMLDRP